MRKCSGASCPCDRDSTALLGLPMIPLTRLGANGSYQAILTAVRIVFASHICNFPQLYFLLIVSLKAPQSAIHSLLAAFLPETIKILN